MIYLDYSATTPVNPEVLDSYIIATKEYIANANSIHSYGVKSKELIDNATKQISKIFSVKESEITYTSSATESNNIALLGVARAYKKNGNRILVSRLEHPSIYAICKQLESEGFIIDYVECDSEGLIDFKDLKNKVTKDTILASIVSVNSEMGIRIPLTIVKQTIHKENPNVIIHSDMTQSIGKVPTNLNSVDLATLSSHKIYGPKGIGLLYKKEKIKIAPILFGSGKSNILNPGTPSLPLIVSFSKALRIAVDNLNKKENHVKKLNEYICEAIKDLKIKINKTSYSIPHILNISVIGVKPETFIHALEKEDIFIGTNTACSSMDKSMTIMAVYNDEERASSSIRVSLSYLTTEDEVKKFIASFKQNYDKLSNL